MSLIKIKDLFHFVKGTLQSTKATPGDFDFITAAAKWKTHTEYTHDCEALVFAAAASGSLGRTHYVNGKFISSDLCFILTPKDVEKYPMDIQFYHLIFNAFKEDIVRNTKSGTSKEAIGLTVFGNYKLPYFEIEKQQNTKKAFLKAQELSQSLEKEFSYQLEEIKNLRQAFLKEAMQGKLVKQHSNDEPASSLLEKIEAEKERLIKEKKIKKQKQLPQINKEEIPFKIPESWIWCRLNDACIKITDGTHHSPVNTETGDYMYVTAKNIKDEGVDLSNITYVTKHVHEEIYSRCDPEFGDVLYIKDGATTGVVTINNLMEPFSLLSSVALLKVDNNLYNRFLMYAMRSPVYYESTRNNMYGVALTRVTIAKIGYSIIPLPPLNEQHRIVAKLDSLMSYCDTLAENINSTKMQNELLLQQNLREALGIESIDSNVKILKPLQSMNADSKFDSNTLLMEIQELLKTHGKLKALELWQMSKFYGKSDEERNIDGFYAELKKLIEKDKLVKESERGYLELV